MSEEPSTKPAEPFQLLPDTGYVQFLAPVADPRAGHEGTVYGAGHITDYVVEDKEFIAACLLDGKLAVIPAPSP